MDPGQQAIVSLALEGSVNLSGTNAACSVLPR